MLLLDPNTKITIKQANEYLDEVDADDIDTNIIKATGDIDFAIGCIEDELLGLSTDKKVDLIIWINIPKYTKKCIENPKLKLTRTAKIELIKSTKDPEYIQKCIHDADLKLRLSEKVGLIKSTGDINYIKKCLKDSTLNLDMFWIVTLIKEIKDVGYIRKCIENNEFDELTTKMLRLLINDETLFEEVMQKYGGNINTPIELPPRMTIGIEIESEGEYSNQISNVWNYKKWLAKDEVSLEDGVEIISPVMSSAEKDTRELYAICSILQDMGQEATEKCGGHIHIGADYLTSKSSYINLLALWGNTEEILYIISNPPGEIIREEALKKHAPPVSAKWENAIETGDLTLNDEGDLDEFIQHLKDCQETRDAGINFMNVGREGKNTIEFRIPNGTIEPETWIQNINLFGSIIRAAEELSNIRPKEQLELFSKICSKSLTGKDMLDALLDLVVSEEQKKIYQQRYEVNSVLYEQKKIKRIMKNKTAKQPINPDRGERIC